MCASCEQKIIAIKKPTCIKCQKLNPSGICHLCKKDLPITKSIIYGYHRDPILRELIHHLKYEGLIGIGQILSDFIINTLEQNPLPKNSILVPIPLNKWRLQGRGFNQSQLIAQKIADHFGLEINNSLLIRQKNTKPQIGLTYKDRQKNMKDAFRLNPKIQIPTGTIVLVDDVVTTGSTVGECAKVLRQAGVKRVWLIALAHG